MPEKTWENLGWFICQERGLNTEEIRYQQRWLMNEQIANCPKAEKVYQYEAWVDLLEAEPVFIFKRSIDYLTPVHIQPKGLSPRRLRGYFSTCKPVRLLQVIPFGNMKAEKLKAANLLPITIVQNWFGLKSFRKWKEKYTNTPSNC